MISVCAPDTVAATCVACLEVVRSPLLTIDSFRVYLCPACQLGFVSPMPHHDDLRRLYEGAYAGTVERAGMKDFYHRVTGRLYHGGNGHSGTLTSAERHALRWIRRHVPGGAVVLDIGCSTGTFLQTLRGAGYHPLGVDIAPQPVAMLREEGFDVAAGSIEAVPAEWPQPAVVTLLSMLYHVARPVDLILRVRDRFPRATIIVSVSGPGRWIPPGTRAVLPGRYDEHGTNPPRHLTGWSGKALRIALQRAGYSHVEVVTPALTTDDIDMPTIRRFVTDPVGTLRNRRSSDRPPVLSAQGSRVARLVKGICLAPYAWWLRRNGYAGTFIHAIGKP